MSEHMMRTLRREASRLPVEDGTDNIVEPNLYKIMDSLLVNFPYAFKSSYNENNEMKGVSSHRRRTKRVDLLLVDEEKTAGKIAAAVSLQIW